MSIQIKYKKGWKKEITETKKKYTISKILGWNREGVQGFGLPMKHGRHVGSALSWHQ